MSAVCTRIVFYLGLCQLLLSLLFVPYGAECRSESRDSKSTKPLVVAPAPPKQPVDAGNNNLPAAEGAGSGSTASSPGTSATLSSVDSKSTRSVRSGDEDAVGPRTRKSFNVGTESTARIDRSARGRQRFQPLDNAIDENAASAKAKVVVAAKSAANDTADVTQAMATTVTSATQSSVENGGKKSPGSENATITSTSSSRAGKATNFRVGGDGYVFEKTFDLHASRTESGEEYAYEPVQEQTVGVLHENNIDRIRNYNDASNNVRIANNVKKPHGFTLTTETTPPLMEQQQQQQQSLYRRPVTSSSSSSAITSYALPAGVKKRITSSVVSDSAPVISLTRPGPGSSTENTNPTSIVSKNEIVRKPSAKPTFSSRRRVTPSSVVSENSLPTTSAVWALAALKTPTSFKSVQKRPSGVEMMRKPIVEHKATTATVPSTMKPFVPWSNRLQHRTTTEDPADATTTFRSTLEADAETFSPFALQGPKLMNSTDVREPLMLATTHRQSNESKNHPMLQSAPLPVVNVTTAAPSSTTPTVIVPEDDIRIDLVDGVEGSSANRVLLPGGANRFNYTTDKATAGQTTTTNETQQTPPFKPAPVDEEDESDGSPKPALDLILKDVLTNSSNFVGHLDDEQQDVIVIPVSRTTSTEMTTTSSTTTSTTTTTTTTSSPSLNNSLIADYSAHEQPPTPSVNVSEAPVEETYTPSAVISSVDNAESNVIYEQSFNSAATNRDIKSRGAIEKKAELQAAPSPKLRNVTEEKQKIFSLEDTVLTISNSHNNNSVVADETRSPHPDTVAIPTFEEADQELGHRTNTNTTSTSTMETEAAPANLTLPTGLEDEFKMNKANGLTYSVNPPPPPAPEELPPSTSTLASTVLKISTSSLDDVQPLITTMRIFHPKLQQSTNDLASSTTTTSTTTTTTTATTSNSSPTIVTSATPSSQPASSFQSSPSATWSVSKEDTSNDFLTTSSPSSSSAANPVTASSNDKFEDLDVDGYADSDEVPFTTLANEIHRQSIAPSSSSSETPSSSSSTVSSSEEVSTPLTTDTLPSTSASTTMASDPLPMVPPFKPNLPPENVPGYLMLFLKSSFADICQPSSALRENLYQYITQRSRVQSKDQVVMLIDPERCKEPDHSLRIIPVALYLKDDLGSYDKTLIDEMKKLLEEEGSNNYSLPIHEIVYYENIAPDNSRVIAAMVITSIAAICFVLLIFLMCTIRNRQKSNYGQRCTPVSADDYNLDNISEYNSIRRKSMMRASKRSYGNPAFDDPTGPSKVLTYNGLLKACESRCSLDEEFSQIPVVTVKPIELPPGAEVKNRYANVIPLPETRVSLSSTNACSDSVVDYINANYVKGFKDADKFYIACQAPLSNTIEDFWKMVWKEQTKVIIMLTGLTENGVEKCADYLPPSEVLDCHRLFGDYQITLKKREVKEKYVISSLQLKNMENNLWREVHHLWYTNWPAQGVPSEQSSIIAFLIEARAYMRNTCGPHVVHCCPGTGRTGTVLAIDICIRDYEMSRTVNIPATVAKLRRCRAGAVQTKEQYAFVYKVLALYARKLHGGAPMDSI